MILESNDPCPHILFSGYQPLNGTDGQNRAEQLNVKDDEDAEALFEKEPEKLRNYKRRFPKENRFPVLMLSYVGPQHGKLFYACMNGQQLVVWQSKLYSFECRATVPLDLFARFLLSSPLREAPAAQGQTKKRRSRLEALEDGQAQPGKRTKAK